MKNKKKIFDYCIEANTAVTLHWKQVTSDNRCYFFFLFWFFPMQSDKHMTRDL